MKRAQQREGDRPGHRLEQAAFHALQSEDGHVRRNDDADGVKHRPLHFMRRLANGAERPSGILGATPSQVTDDVLHHHHRAFHHHAEIQRAQRQQIRGNVRQAETNGRE